MKKIWYKCRRCNFERIGENILAFIEDMELVKECENCGGSFKFKCLECGVVNKTRNIDEP